MVPETVDSVLSRLRLADLNATTETVRSVVSQLAERYPRAGPTELVPLAVDEIRKDNQRQQQTGVESVQNATNVTGETIDRHTTLVDSEMRDGAAIIKIRSDVDQSILLTDAAAAWEGGDINQRQVYVEAGETVKVRMQVTTYRRMAAVTLSASELGTLYGVPLERGQRWFEGQSTWETVQIAGAGGAAGVIAIAGILIAYLKRGGSKDQERIA